MICCLSLALRRTSQPGFLAATQECCHPFCVDLLSYVANVGPPTLFFSPQHMDAINSFCHFVVVQTLAGSSAESDRCGERAILPSIRFLAENVVCVFPPRTTVEAIRSCCDNVICGVNVWHFSGAVIVAQPATALLHASPFFCSPTFSFVRLPVCLSIGVFICMSLPVCLSVVGRPSLLHLPHG